ESFALQCVNISFIFRAEDGIRDRNVTGVQTCALPTSPSPITTLSMESSSGCATSVAQRVGANSTMTRLPTITSATDCRRTTRGGVVKNYPLTALNSANIATSSPGLQLTCKLIH